MWSLGGTGRFGLVRPGRTYASALPEAYFEWTGRISRWHSAQLGRGLLDLTSNFPFIANGSPLLITDGVFRKSAGAGTKTIPATLPVINNGTILVQTGALSLSSSLTNPTGALAVAGGKIQSATALVLPGGMITGSGTIESPSITSAAMVDPGATDARLIISGNYTQQLAGSIQFEIGGTNAGVDQSQVLVTGNASLNGSVGVQFSPGYSPESGDDFTVLQAASLNGAYQCFDGFLLLGENKRLAVGYSPTNLVFTALSAPDPIGPSLNIAAPGPVMICWPAEFAGYDLYGHTNLAGGDWTLIPGATNRHFELPLVPQKFFRLEKQPQAESFTRQQMVSTRRPAFPTVAGCVRWK